APADLRGHVADSAHGHRAQPARRRQVGNDRAYADKSSRSLSTVRQLRPVLVVPTLPSNHAFDSLLRPKLLGMRRYISLPRTVILPSGARLGSNASALLATVASSS